jgi:cytochrome c biogenesis protein CcdA
MNSPEHLPSETHKPITGYLWGALAVLTCPCHLPILAIVLGSAWKTESMVTPVFATPILTTSWLA